MANSWYTYVGGSGFQPQFNALNYRLTPDDVLVNGKPPCSGVSLICAIFAPDGGLTPVSPLPQNVQNAIIAAIADSTISYYPQAGQILVLKKD